MGEDVVPEAVSDEDRGEDQVDEVGPDEVLGDSQRTDNADDGPDSTEYEGV